MERLNKKSGFTLLEIIIVIIIIGVLASLALPRFFKTVEYSRATEALSHLSSIRQAVNRCYLPTNSYANCNTFANLDIDDPSSIATGGPTAHFDYTIAVPGVGGAAYTVTATRNGFEGTNVGDTIQLDDTGAKRGTNQYSSVR